MTQPNTPSTAYLEAMEGDVAKRVASATPPEHTEEDYPGQEKAWDASAALAEGLRETAAHIVADLHAHPETAFEEHRSMAVLADIVEEHGFSTRRGVYGVDTAFEATWRSEDFDPKRHPTVAILAEYDALPQIGHACGHNIIAAAGVTGFLAATAALVDVPLPGRILLQGTPAEEGHSGKEYMIRGGSLDGVDAAVMIHGFGYDIGAHAWVGRRILRVRFRGVAAHASSQPFMGRNALDAASLAYQGIGLMRQQMPPSDRVHATMAGGDRPSIIPKSADMHIYVRSLGTRTLMDLSGRVEDIVRGAALMAGVEVDLEWDEHPMTLPVRNNAPLVERWAATQARRGRTALPAGTVPDTVAASTDFGNVSNLVPGLHPMVKVSPSDVALHTEDFARWAATPQAVDAAVDSAAGLAQVTLDFLADPEFRRAAREDFDKQGPVAVDTLLAGGAGTPARN
ncbi:M20 family metallopeptidase [Corynebacterium minutissimum]|uniref:Peptidase M20 domain-containing protein 2 n=2 Tax=Corynebacterium minutissimum TaxID=38301 RepID=A0A7T2XNJ7_9CORY|nr:M20 family metallopeptidase [Corynebacterium minutissimum]KHO30157.1 peptidase M20 [Corynebacterium minutissimum]QPS60642.1 M20 family metallopeptidase [Corynebacterium minutissimum]QQA78571.1 M20 family metallopeptidase [Corynebacterium minutissimum]